MSPSPRSWARAWDAVPSGRVSRGPPDRAAVPWPETRHAFLPQVVASPSTPTMLGATTVLAMDLGAASEGDSGFLESPRFESLSEEATRERNAWGRASNSRCAPGRRRGADPARSPQTGTGACFRGIGAATACLPRDRAPGPAARHLSAPRSPLPRFPEGIRVLVVDDDPVCLRIVQKVLQHCKFEVSTSTSGSQAIELLKADPDRFHIVLSDVHMPDMDGFKCARGRARRGRLRAGAAGIDRGERRRAFAIPPARLPRRLLERIGIEMDIPVIMMSSNGDTSVVYRGITAGAVDYLIKPVRIEELRNIWRVPEKRNNYAICYSYRARASSPARHVTPAPSP